MNDSLSMSGPASRRAVAAPGLRANHRAVGRWLFGCCLFLFVLIVVGGATRLTHSGLSIVEWQPLIGTLPPLSDAQWLETFEKYKLTPEYQKVNRGMSLEAFKGIFWWEYVHRLLARSLGVVFAVPLAWFVLRRRIDAALGWKLAGILLLGGLQGAMGWFMVKSGLVDDPRVSHLRLTAHLGLAFAIFAAMFALGAALLDGPRAGPAASPGLRRAADLTAFLVFVQVLLGGLVAGTRAGFAYNTFPLMDGNFIPPEIGFIEPWWRNIFFNVATIQFDHRLLAWAIVAIVGWMVWRALSESPGRRARFAVHMLAIVVVAQFVLGVVTLLARVPVGLGVAHQGGAVALFAAALWAACALRGEPSGARDAGT